MKRFLLTLLLLTSSQAYAFHDTAYVKYGLGVFKSSEHSTTQTKSFAIGYQFQMHDLFVEQVELGGWIDRYKGSSGYGSYQFGLSADTPSGFYAQAFLGAAILTDTDQYLGGHVQFKENFGIGMLDGSGTRVGFEYQHMSSAGIFSPNIGRDIVYFRVAFKL